MPKPRSCGKLRWSHPTRGEWIEIFVAGILALYEMSHPTRGEWIEIASNKLYIRNELVSPHTG